MTRVTVVVNVYESGEPPGSPPAQKDVREWGNLDESAGAYDVATHVFRAVEEWIDPVRRNQAGADEEDLRALDRLADRLLALRGRRP